jgi:hypothetical protein
MYINTETLQYPLTVDQIKAAQPNTSFPVNYAPSAPYAPVLQSPQPSYNAMTQYCREIEPALVGDSWMQQWQVVDLDPEQIAYNENQAKAANKAQAASLLTATDWTTIPDVSDPANNPHLTNYAEFLSYRLALRAIAVNPPVVAVFPPKPDEVWFF